MKKLVGVGDCTVTREVIVTTSTEVALTVWTSLHVVSVIQAFDNGIEALTLVVTTLVIDLVVSVIVVRSFSVLVGVTVVVPSTF